MRIVVCRVASLGPWFIEVFSGTARLTLTQVVASLGIPCLPPIDVTLSPSVPVAFDVVDARKWDFFMQLVTLAAIAFAHFGTPCNTLSAARKDDGGPPPCGRWINLGDSLDFLQTMRHCSS